MKISQYPSATFAWLALLRACLASRHRYLTTTAVSFPLDQSIIWLPEHRPLYLGHTLNDRSDVSAAYRPGVNHVDALCILRSVDLWDELPDMLVIAVEKAHTSISKYPGAPRGYFTLVIAESTLLSGASLVKSAVGTLPPLEGSLVLPASLVDPDGPDSVIDYVRGKLAALTTK